MVQYEIRILRPNKTAAMIFIDRQPDNAAVIEAAESMARGRAVEIWRGSDCVYRTPPHKTRTTGHAA